jgi:N-acetylneuraminic acid mutarotase
MKKYLLLSYLLTIPYLLLAQFAPNWVQKNDLSTERAGATGLVINGEAYLVGGATSQGYTSDFLKYNATNDTWEAKASIPWQGTLFVAFEINGKGYVGMCYNGSDGTTGFFEYEPSENEWTEKASFPGGGRYSAIGFSIADKGYVGMGTEGTSFINDFYEYNPTNDEWTIKTPCPGSGRTYGSSVSYGNLGYVGLGFRSPTGALSDFWSYNPALDTGENPSPWTQLANFEGGGRWRANEFVLNQRIYIGNGNNGSSDVNSYWAYDPLTNLWESVETLDVSRVDAASFSIGNKAFVVGGIGNSATLNDVWQYTTPILLTAISNGNTISLSWEDDGDTKSGYEIWRRAENEAEFGLINTVDDETLDYSDENVQTGTKYFYKIRAVLND